MQNIGDRIVITGVGVISPIGIGKEAFFSSLEEGISGIKDISMFDTSSLKCKQASEIPEFNAQDYLSQRGLKYLSRSAQFACAATALALADLQLDLEKIDSSEIGVVIGSAFGNINSMIEFDKEAFYEGARFVTPMRFPNTVVCCLAGYISIFWGFTGVNATISNGFSSSLDAINFAVERLRRNEAKIIFAGGCEELSLYVYLGFLKAHQLSGSKDKEEEVSTPFDKNRNGFFLGEGAVILALERLDHALWRGANILAEIIGFGNAFAPAIYQQEKATIQAEAKAMVSSLCTSSLSPEEISCIFAHANGSLIDDKTEARAISQVFNSFTQTIPVTAIKSMIGECCGASGAFQVAGSVFSMQKNLVPATINFQAGDTDFPLGGVSKEKQPHECETVMVNSFNGKHNNSTLILKHV